MNTNEKDQEVLEELRIISGLNMEQVTEVLQAFSILVAMNYGEKEKIHIPFFGNFYLKYDGDEVTEEGREAKVTGFFSPHEFLKKVIGQIEDSKNGEDSFSNNPLIEELKKKIFWSMKSDL